MIKTTQSALLVAAENQRGPPMRAKLVEKAKASVGIAECHIALTEYLD